MKNILLLAGIMMIATACFSQKIDVSQVPDYVKKSFQVKIGDSLNETWTKENEFYTGSFVKSGMKASAKFKDNGEWESTRWEVPFEFVPAKIKENITATYPAYKSTLSVIEFRPGGDYYIITLKKKKDMVELHYNIKGDFIKVEKPPVK